MILALVKGWWLFLVRGIAAIVLSVLAFVAPGATLQALVYVLGLYIFIAGCFAVWAGASGSAGSRWWAVFLEGLLGIAVALVMWSMPEGTAQILVYLFAGWAIVTGILEIAAGVQFRDLLDSNEWLYIASGIISLAFGVWVIRTPQQGALAEVWIVGVYAALYGFAQIAFSIRLRSLRTTIGALQP